MQIKNGTYLSLHHHHQIPPNLHQITTTSTEIKILFSMRISYHPIAFFDVDLVEFGGGGAERGNRG